MMDLEDARKRLESPDFSVKSRCLERLLETIRQKKQKFQQITADSKQIPELLLLWDICSSGSFSTLSVVVDGLISLVQDDCVELEYAIKKCVNVATHAKNLVPIVSGLTCLITHRMDRVDKSTREDYSMHYPRHPFIDILETRSDAWSVIIQSIMDIITLKSDRSSNFVAVEPVISYILFRPSKTEESNLMLMQRSLLSSLCSLGQRQPIEIFRYFCDILPYLQIKESFELENASTIITYLGQLLSLLKSSDGVDDYLSDALFSSLAISIESMERGLNPLAVLDSALVICSYIDVNEKCPATLSACYILISIMLKEGCTILLQKLLKLCNTLLEKSKPSRLISALLMVSYIEVLSCPKTICQSGLVQQQLSASFKQLISHFQQPKQEDHINPSAEDLKMFCFTAINYHTSHAYLFAGILSELEHLSVGQNMNWLEHVRTMIGEGHPVASYQFQLVAALVLQSSGDKDYLHGCLKLIETICIKETMFSTKTFSLLLYQQSCESNPECLQLILEYLPRTVTHKFAVGPVLSFLQLMANNQAMKPQAIYLMLQLWKNQERCFPHLQKMLVEDEGSVAYDTGICAVRLAQSSVIHQLCLEGPERYGTEFLNVLSGIINKSSADSSTPAMLLALDAVYHLCKSGALNIRSAWEKLAPKLSKDTRLPIKVRVCRFLSLTPQLQEKNFQYGKFMNDIAAYLWRMISAYKMEFSVIGEAYKALSHFPMDCHNLKLIPKEGKVNLKLPQTMMSTPYEAAKLPEDVLTYIPGYCFVDILRKQINTTLHGYKEFLRSVISHEIKDLPRDVYLQRRAVGKRNNPNDLLSSVPGMLCNQYSVKKSFSGKNLAVGILLSYEPPVETDKEGKPLRHSLASHLGNYEQILEILLNEVNLDSNEWLRCVLLPEAWSSFMERMLFACEDSRRAELQMQKTNGHLKVSNEEFSYLMDTVWLWVRDRILERIRLNSSNSSSATGNSVFAISGLVRALEKLYCGLDEKTKEISKTCEKYLDQDSFQKICTESILSLLNPDRCPSEKVFGWLLTNLSKQSTSAGSLIRGCAAAALCNIQVVIERSFTDRIQDICELLLHNVTKDPLATSNLYCGIGLGFFILSTCQEDLCHGSKEKAQHALEFAKNVKQSCCTKELKCGNVVALTILVSALSKSVNATCSKFMKDTCQEFHEKLLNESSDSVAYDYLSICVTCMMVSACAANIVPLEEGKTLSSWLFKKIEENPQCSSSAAAIAVLLDSLVILGDSKSEEMLDVVRKTWFNSLASEKEPTLKRLAALSGLCSSYSAGRGLVKLKETTRSASKIHSLKDLVKLLVQFVTNTRDSGMQNISCWELGNLYATNNRDPTDTNIVPSSYSYLGDRSTLKPLLQFLVDVSNNGISIQSQTALEALSGKFSRPLPPLNWISLLTPFLQSAYEPDLVETSLRIALNQMSSSTTALSIISSYATPPILQTLPQKCQLLLMKNISLMASSLNPSHLKAFLNSTVITVIEEERDFEVTGVIALQAMLECYSLLSNKDAAAVFEEIFVQAFEKNCKNINFFHKHFSLLCEVFTRLPYASQDRISRDMEEEYLNLIFLVYCDLVEKGTKPFSALKPYLEKGKLASTDIKNRLIIALTECFCGGRIYSASDMYTTENCLNFLMETIGWIRVLSKSRGDISMEISFMFSTCLAIIVGTSGYKVNFALWRSTEMSQTALLQALPTALIELMGNGTSEDSIEKILIWLLEMKKSSYLSQEEKYHVQAALCALRNSRSYQKPSIWTKAVNCPTLNI